MRQIVIKPFLDPLTNHLQTVFRVPGDMKVDLGIDAVGHRSVGRFGKDVKTPFLYFFDPYHVLKDVAICPSGKPPARGKTIKSVYLSPEVVRFPFGVE